MNRNTALNGDNDADQKRLKEESEKARQAREVSNLSAETVARSKRHQETKQAPKTDDR